MLPTERISLRLFIVTSSFRWFAHLRVCWWFDNVFTFFENLMTYRKRDLYNERVSCSTFHRLPPPPPPPLLPSLSRQHKYCSDFHCYIIMLRTPINIRTLALKTSPTERNFVLATRFDSSCHACVCVRARTYVLGHYHASLIETLEFVCPVNDIIYTRTE